MIYSGATRPRLLTVSAKQVVGGEAAVWDGPARYSSVGGILAVIWEAEGRRLRNREAAEDWHEKRAEVSPIQIYI